jgi:hypothetical protein
MGIDASAMMVKSRTGVRHHAILIAVDADRSSVCKMSPAAGVLAA